MQYYDPNDQGVKMVQSTDGLIPVKVGPERSTGILHRSGIAAVDKLPTIVITAADNAAVVGVMAASEHKIAVAPGNRYGTAGPCQIVAATPTLNKTIDIFIPQCIGAEWYDIFFHTDAAPKWLGRISETQRAAGCAITAVGTVAAGGAAGTKQVETLTVTHGASKAGIPDIKITSALFAAPVIVPVSVLATDDTVNEVAAKIRTALAANASVAAHFTVSGADAAVILTAIMAAHNDATLAIELDDDGDTGVTVGSSANTTAGVAAVLQVETATAEGTVTTAGNALVTVTSALFDEAEAVDVPVEEGDGANDIALAIRIALAANALIAAHFTVGGLTNAVILTAKVAAANDATLNIAIDDGTGDGASEGVTAAASSANTTAGVAPVQQVETIPVSTGATKDGNLTVTVTANGMTGSPKAVEIPIGAHHDTAAKVAAVIRAALAADASIAAFFTVGGTVADIVLTAKTAAANDATMALALSNDGSTSVTVGESADTTAGVAPAINVRLVGTGVASNEDPFKFNNAYTPASITKIPCTGKSKAYLYVLLGVTDLRSAPALSILPFLENSETGDWAQGALQAVTLLTALGKSLSQVFSIDVDRASGLVVCIDAISGQGAAATVYVELV